ncbi:hypothetical protein AGMMS49944_16420 [Spirochaetia bacterium]|nr:hypothetical protein AGMMS49944_16420 [Spirochaetia bacterium]
MNIFAIFRRKEPETPTQINLRQGLEKWNKYIKRTHHAWINIMFHKTNRRDLVAALVYSDRSIVDYIINAHIASGMAGVEKDMAELREQVKNNPWGATEEQGDKAKAHIMNNVIPHFKNGLDIGENQRKLR